MNPQVNSEGCNGYIPLTQERERGSYSPPVFVHDLTNCFI